MNQALSLNLLLQPLFAHKNRQLGEEIFVDEAGVNIRIHPYGPVATSMAVVHGRLKLGCR